MATVRFVEGDVPDHFLVFPTLNTDELNKWKTGEIKYNTFFNCYCFTPVRDEMDFPFGCDLTFTSDELTEIAAKLKELDEME
jgi:hypothetical protein